MIRALDTSGKASFRLFTHARAAMPADIVISPFAGDDDTLARNIAQEVGARLLDPLRSSGVDPAAEVKPLHLCAKVLRIGVILGRQCHRRHAVKIMPVRDSPGLSASHPRIPRAQVSGKPPPRSWPHCRSKDLWRENTPGREGVPHPLPSAALNCTRRLPTRSCCAPRYLRRSWSPAAAIHRSQ